MEALFLKLINMSITASWLVLAVIAVRLIFKKAPKWILCLLWGLVAFRLICPFSIESSLSLIPYAEPLSQNTAYSSETVKQARGEILDAEGNVIVERKPVANGEILDSDGNVIVEIKDGIRTYPEKELTKSWSFYFSRIWLLGFAVMLAYTAVSYYLLKRKVATAVPIQWGIKQSEYVDSPFVLGIIRPVIYLPFHMSEGDLSYVVAHEKAHIRRRDHWWKPLGFLLLSVYWFNPVLWVAYILLCRDIEAACDEKVIREMDKDGRRAYSTALLNCSVHRRRIAACPLAFGEVGVKARVKGIMNYRRPAFRVILITLAISIVVAVCFLTNPQSALPITMTADYVNRTRADLKFHFEKQLPEGGYQISEVYKLESLVDGTWQELPKLMEKQPCELVVEVTANNVDFDAWSLPNWEDVYGTLPDGSYRITKAITIHSDSEQPETYPVSVEFTIGGTADEYVTFTMEDITPTGAKLYEHETVTDEFQLIYNGDGDIWLESYQDGQWTYVEPTEYIESILKKDRHYIHQLIYPSQYIQLDWSSLYGELPDGTYRIAREVTNTAEDNLRVCTAYAEFTISSSPVTISLENVRPYGARILFHQNKDLIDGKLLCNREFFLEKKVDGQWVDMKEGIIPLDVEDDPYDIALLAYQDVSWVSTYGTLPVGSYRLGKVIPITSGENPEYETVYAEFSIDKVYTWFDLYSNDADERHPKDNMLDIGVEGTGILSYHPELNTIYLIGSEGREPLISCDVIIRNVFLTDLTGDGVSEVCATVQNEDNMHVQVYDAMEEQLYELPVENSGYKLSKKADRLCVYRNDEYGNPVGYWQLTLQPGSGIVLADLDPEVEALKSKLLCVDVNTRKRTCLSSGQQLNQAITLLRDLRDTAEPATAEELAQAEKNGINITWVTVNYELGERNLFFSENFDLVWEPGATEAFRIPDPKPIRQFVESVTDGVRNKETSGEPFATADAPWDWCQGLNENAVSTAEVYACLDVTSSGNSTSVSATNGILPADSLQRLIPILNRIPREAFAKTEKFTSDYSRFQLGDQIEGTCSVSLIDGVNQMAVMLRAYKGSVEMILTNELDKAQQGNYEYLSTPATIWTIKDSSLRGYLDDIRENPPVINYSVGAEYKWQGPIEFESEGFSMELYLIEDWEYANVMFHDHSGIRCRPKGVTEGWIYFSFWPDGYSAEEEDRYYGEGLWNGFTTKTSYPSSVKSTTGVDTRHSIWSYEVVNTDIGDFAIINDGADDWFPEYEDQISDTMTILTFTTE